jgi:hypothetical protein
MRKVSGVLLALLTGLKEQTRTLRSSAFLTLSSIISALSLVMNDNPDVANFWFAVKRPILNQT